MSDENTAPALETRQVSTDGASLPSIPSVLPNPHSVHGSSSSSEAGFSLSSPLPNPHSTLGHSSPSSPTSPTDVPLPPLSQPQSQSGIQTPTQAQVSGQSQDQSQTPTPTPAQFPRNSFVPPMPIEPVDLHAILNSRRMESMGLGTAPASARTSFTRVNENGAGSVLEAEHHDGEDECEGREEGEEDGGNEGEVNGEQAPPQTPRTWITFLLVSGKRRMMSFEPDTTVGRVKELVWNTWPSEPEWQDERPPAPSYLRILYLGKILQDDDTLSKLNIPATQPSADTTTNPIQTIVHLSIRPYAVPSEDEQLKGKKRGKRRRAATEGSTGTEEGAEGDMGRGCCGCVIC